MSTYQMQQLLEKSRNGDPDYRWMSLSDICKRVAEPNFQLDDATEKQLVEQVLAMFADNNSEVKSMAAKTISMLVGKVKEDRVQIIIEKLTAMTSSKEDIRDIASLALKTVVQEISPSSKLASTACTKLAPKILQQLRNTDSSQDVLVQLLEVLADIYARLESTIRTMPAIQKDGLSALTPLLNDSRNVVRKRSIRAIANLVMCSGGDIYSELMTKDVVPALTSGSDTELKTSVALCGALANAAPTKVGKRLDSIIPAVVKASSRDDEDLKEIALQTLESFVLRCSSDMTPWLTQTLDTASNLIKYDPNYAGDDEEAMDEDDEMNGENDDEDEDDEYAEEYVDDDDVSWKVRRAAAKVFQTAIETRLDVLPIFYKSIAPVLVARFTEREETVRLEIWSTYSILLKQTALWTGQLSGNIKQSNGVFDDNTLSRAASPATLKRKRGTDEQSDDTPLTSLSAQSSQVSRIVIKQLTSTKSLALRQAGFLLLQQLVAVLNGGLDTAMPSLMAVIETSLRTADSGSTSSAVGGSSTALKLQIYSFLALLLGVHHSKTIQPHLNSIVALVTQGISDKPPKIAAQAFLAASELVKLLRPEPSTPLVGPSTHLSSIFEATTTCLSRPDTDQEVRERGIICLGNLVTHTGGEVAQNLDKALKILRERLRNENTTLITLTTISKIAGSSASGIPAVQQFLQECVSESVGFLRRSDKAVQLASFTCLEAILRGSASKHPIDNTEQIIEGVRPFTVDPGMNLSRALAVLIAVMGSASKTSQAIQAQVLPNLFRLIGTKSSSISSHVLESLMSFFAAYVKAGGDLTAVYQSLSQCASSAEAGISAPLTAARLVGAAYRAALQTGEAPSTAILQDCASKIKAAKSPSNVVSYALFVLGEIGRQSDLSNYSDLFEEALKQLGSANDDVRNASAFAIGNMAIGSPATFMPAVLGEIEKAQKDDRRLQLLLGSVKDILSQRSNQSLAELSQALWKPLFTLCQKTPEQATKAKSAEASASSAKAGDDARHDGTRTVAAECLGKITLTNPGHYLPELQQRLKSDSAGARAAVITAIRFTLTDESSTYDDLLQPLIADFLASMQDPDLTVRRLSVSALTSAAHNKPHLIRDHLAKLQPQLYGATRIDPSLIHEVVMGPFKVKVDDGLSIRKAAYQCMYTLMETSLNRLDLNSYLDIVTGGLSDDDDIKVTCCLMLVKLSHVARTAVIQRLDSAAAAFETKLKEKSKESDVKQEKEKLLEIQRTILRTMAALQTLASESATPRFSQLVAATRNSPLWSADYREMVAAIGDNKQIGATSDSMDTD